MKNIKHLLLGLLLMSIPHIAMTQSTSPYSRYGLGDFQAKGSTRTRIMGGAGVAMQNKSDVNNINPSSLVAMDSLAVLFDIGLHAVASNYSDGESSQMMYSGNLDYVALMVPMTRNWFFAANLQPLTSVGYNINTVTAYNGSYPETHYATNYAGNGGMSLATVTNSFKLPFGFSVGAEIGLLWGNQEETITESYVGLDVSTSVRNDIYYHTGFWATGGIQYTHTFDKLSFILGGVYNFPTTIVSYKEETTYTSLGKIQDESGRTTSTKLPMGYGAGLSVTYDKKLTISGDYKFNEWSGTGLGVDPNRLTDNHIFSLGGEYVPNFNSNKYIDRIAYRGGIHHETGYFTVLNESVSSGYVSLGLGLPGRTSSTIVNIGIEVGTMGGFNGKHLDENYGRINIGLNLGEIWFVKPKFY